MTQTCLNLPGVTVCALINLRCSLILSFLSLRLPADHADCHLHECHRYQRSGARWVSRRRRPARHSSPLESKNVLPPPNCFLACRAPPQLDVPRQTLRAGVCLGGTTSTLTLSVYTVMFLCITATFWAGVLNSSP